MLSFHLFCHEDAARRIARDPLNRFLRSLVDAAGDWVAGTSSADYPGYDKIFQRLSEATFESAVAHGVAWVGTPATIAAQIRDYAQSVGGFEVASVQVEFQRSALR